MKRRQLLLGATTVVGGGAFVKSNPDKIPDIPDAPEPNLGSGNSTSEEETSIEEVSDTEDLAHLMKWRYWHYSPDHSGTNDYNGRAEVNVKNTGEITYDYQVKFTPIHKNGTHLNTRSEENTIDSLEYKTFDQRWTDNDTRYVESLLVEILVSDEAWFNGWETVYKVEHEF